MFAATALITLLMGTIHVTKTATGTAAKIAIRKPWMTWSPRHKPRPKPMLKRSPNLLQLRSPKRR